MLGVKGGGGLAGAEVRAGVRGGDFVHTIVWQLNIATNSEILAKDFQAFVRHVSYPNCNIRGNILPWLVPIFTLYASCPSDI